VFTLDLTRRFIQVPQDSISVLYQSVNNASVLLPGQPSAQASAVVVGFRIESKVYGVLVGLHLVESKRHLIYVHEDAGLDPDGARTAAHDAITFVESMGFFMENSGWKDLDPVARRERMVSLKVFQPPEEPSEAPKPVVDPRTKLARLLVQF
jgi:hypothetical protein